MHITLFTLIAIVIAYLLGSISSSVVICKLTKNPDPRKEGSGNPGATNVLRLAGKKIALATLICDMAKGLVAVIIGRLLAQHGFNISLVALAVFVGHIYPVFHGFKGGKGVATGFGALLGLSPIVGIAALITWGVIAAIFRYSSLAALVAYALTPIYCLLLSRLSYIIALIAIAALVFYRHKANIMRLKNRTETKIGQK